MSVPLFKRAFRGLRLRSKDLPTSSSPILGTGIDVMTLPEGHMACSTCHGYKFEASVLMDKHRVELGCIECNAPYRLLFPLDVVMPEKQGRFYCKRHPDKGMIVIHNTDVLSIGCERCFTEINFQLRKAGGIIIPDA